jgi:hypothetical protein
MDLPECQSSSKKIKGQPVKEHEQVMDKVKQMMLMDS